MTDDDATGEESVGSVQVKVSPRAVHKAVRNILANEMGVSREAVEQTIRGLVKEVAEAKIESFCLSYLKDNGYGGAQLHSRVKTAMERQIDEIKPVVKDVARDLVHEVIRQDVEGVVEGIVRDGIKVRLGWNREAKISVEATAHARRDWVKVGDRLPADGRRVMVYHGNAWNSGMNVSPAIHETDGRFLDGKVLIAKVTHWRDFPDSPARED